MLTGIHFWSLFPNSNQQPPNDMIKSYQDSQIAILVQAKLNELRAKRLKKRANVFLVICIGVIVLSFFFFTNLQMRTVYQNLNDSGIHYRPCAWNQQKIHDAQYVVELHSAEDFAERIGTERLLCIDIDADVVWFEGHIGPTNNYGLYYWRYSLSD